MKISSLWHTEKGKKYLIACSGGRDSISLAHILHSKGYTIALAYFEHGIRKQESLNDQKFVEQFAAQLGVPFFTTSVDIISQGKNIENTAREFRYAWLNQVRQEQGYDYICTGHHQDDQVESVVWALLRKSGVRGCAGIAEKKWYILRPLLQVSREDINDYICQNNLEYCEDSTNVDMSYNRNYLRHLLIPLMKERNTDFASHILSLQKKNQDHFLQLSDRLEKDRVNGSISLSNFGWIQDDREYVVFFLADELGIYMSQAANMYDQWLAYTPGKCIVMGKRKWKKTQTGLVLVSHS